VNTTSVGGVGGGVIVGTAGIVMLAVACVTRSESFLQKHQSQRVLTTGSLPSGQLRGGMT